MKLVINIFATIIMVLGALLGLYVTVWWGWVGGIIALVEAFKQTDIPAMTVALSILRIFFASAIGAIIAWSVIALGALVGASASK